MHIMRREEHCVGRRAMGVDIQWRRRLDIILKSEKGLSGRKCTTELHGDVYHHIYQPDIKVGLRAFAN